jgi:hypothetical protein
LCLSTYDEVFRNYGRRAVELATQEMLKRRKLVAKDRNGTRSSKSAKLLCELLTEMETREELLLLRKKEFAQRAMKVDGDPVPVGIGSHMGAKASAPVATAFAAESDHAKAAKPTYIDPFAAAALQNDGTVFPESEN